MGWGGLDNARDCLDPETERVWLDEYGAPPKEDCDRFIAEVGCGMAELWLMPPRVCTTSSKSVCFCSDSIKYKYVGSEGLVGCVVVEEEEDKSRAGASG